MDVLLAVFLFLALPSAGKGRGETVDFATFMTKVEQGGVKAVTIEGQHISGTWTNETRFQTTGPEFVEPVYNTLLEHGVTPNFKEISDDSIWLTAVFALVPVAVVVVLFVGSASQKTLPWQMFTGLREQISPTILAVATILVVISIALLTTVELLRRRSERLRGMSPG